MFISNDLGIILPNLKQFNPKLMESRTVVGARCIKFLIFSTHSSHLCHTQHSYTKCW